MLAAFGSIQRATEVIAEHERGRAVLAETCELDPVRSVEACDNRWCSYFDEDQRRCALLVWNVNERLGEQALRWFAAHRATKPAADVITNEALAMRVGAL